MRITLWQGHAAALYTSNVALIRGDWNAIADLNTLVDVGRDLALLERLTEISTGVGKRAVEQVILTHGHFDHVGLLPTLRERYGCQVMAHSAFVGADRVLQDGEQVRCGDRQFEVLYAPVHSQDSICLYCAQEGTLFSGDMPIMIHSAQGTYPNEFAELLARLVERGVRVIYPGHGEPIVEQAQSMLDHSLRVVRQAQSQEGPADG
jgi:glyoxylase-like metal-dependent hydrolase (beta-lactamase superfamily II)